MREKPVTVRSGRYEFLKINASPQKEWDGYHWLLTLRWPAFIACLAIVYLAINLLFSLLYLIAPNDISGMTPKSWSDAFFFSVETLATVGYGHMYPQTLFGHVVTMLEIMIGMFSQAVVTGLIFVRFSRPTARVVFSRTAVVSPFNGQPALMVRIGNMRQQALVEVEFRMMAAVNEMTLEGEEMRRFYPLKLQFDRLLMFPAALTVRHEITADSPLHGMTPEDWEARDVRILASVEGMDTVLHATVQSQEDYSWREVRFNERFVEIYSAMGVDRLQVDYGLLHDTEPLP